MGSWILVIVIWWTPSGDPTTYTKRYETLEACENVKFNASMRLRDLTGEYHIAYTECSRTR